MKGVHLDEGGERDSGLWLEGSAGFSLSVVWNSGCSGIWAWGSNCPGDRLCAIEDSFSQVMSTPHDDTASSAPLKVPLDAYSGRTVLVTGGRGYIGSALTQSLAAVDCRIVVLDQSQADAWAPTESVADISFRCGDISNRKTWEEVLPGVDCVFHLAAREYHYRSGYDLGQDLASNALPTLHLLDVCRTQGISPRVVFASSANLFGRVSSLPVNEEHPDDPLTAWAIHKLMAEKYLKLYEDLAGISSATLRLTNVYGPTARTSVVTRVVINHMIAKALAGETLLTYSNHDRVRDYVFLVDVVNAFLLVGAPSVSSGHDMYVLGSGEGHTIGEVWRLIADRVEASTGGQVLVESDDSVEIELLERRSFVADTSRLTEAVGWKPQTSLAEGIDVTLRALLPMVRRMA
jgi:UDP-glucose 4-epimerase